MLAWTESSNRRVSEGNMQKQRIKGKLKAAVFLLNVLLQTRKNKRPGTTAIT